jgi:hypothetical protein
MNKRILLSSFLYLVFLGLVISPMVGVAATKDVYLESYYQYSAQNNPEAPIIWGIAARFKNSSSRPEAAVLVLRLHNSAGQLIKASSKEVTISSQAIELHQLTTDPGLVEGTYYWSADVYKKNGRTLVHPYSKIAEFQLQ